MIQRFFFNRVNAEAAGATVSGQDDFIALARPHKAEALLAIAQFAEARTDIALDPAVFQRMPIAA